MECIQLVFGIRIDGGDFPELSFVDTTPEYKNITLNPIDTDKSLYEILVEKSVSSFAGDELRSVIHEATSEAQTFVYVFSVAADVKIFEFTCKGYKYQDLLVSLDQALGQGQGASSQAHCTVTTGLESIAQVKQKMRQHYDLSRLQTFFDSATVIEPIGRFISLYTLMLHYCSDSQKPDSQKKVDEVIVNIDPTVAQYKSPKGNGYETVFTKLRNELSHKRDGVIMVETHEQVRKNVDRFERIVKAHVLGAA